MLRCCLLIFVLLLGMARLSVAQAEDCLSAAFAGSSAMPRFDPLNGAILEQPFQLHFAGAPGAIVEFQLADTNDVGRIGRDGPGPYYIELMNRAQLAGDVGGTQPNILRPAGQGLFGPRGILRLDGNGMAVTDLRLLIEPGPISASVRAQRGGYREDLELIYRCGQAEPVFYRSGVSVGVMVDNILKAGFGSAGNLYTELDFGDLPASGAGVSRTAPLVVQATGPFDVEFGFNHSEWKMVLESGQGQRPDGRDNVPIEVYLNGQEVNPGHLIRCEPRSNRPLELPVEVRTEDSPGAGRIAGTYRAEISITISPRFEGGAANANCW